MATDNNSLEVHRDLGRLEGRVEALEERLAFLNSEVLAMRKDMQRMLSILDRTQGSWKTLVAVGGMMATLGALATSLVNTFGGKN